MTPEAFFRSAETGRILRWAIQASPVPLAIHSYEGAREDHCVYNSGKKCAACAFILRTGRGPVVCRQAREAAAKDAFRLNMAYPFICHVGFACCSAPLELDGRRFTLCFGPYVPSEEPRAVEIDYMSGLRKLRPVEGDFPPVDFDDIQMLPVSSVPAIAEQTARMLRDLWERYKGAGAGMAADEGSAPPKKSKRRVKPAADPYNSATIAAAMAAGDRDQARALIRSALEYVRTGKRTPVPVLRARAVTTACGAIEAGCRAGANADAFAKRFPEFLGKIAQAKTCLSLAMVVLDFLQVRKRRDSAEPTPDAGLETLHEYIVARLHEGLTLNEAAAALGRHPTSITHFLRRKYGMSFSDYVGRLRIDTAKDLLRRTRLSTSEVSQRIGIEDQSNFAKLFKKFELTTPAEYRARCRPARVGRGKKK